MLELDHNCNTDVNINIYFNIGTDHILLPALPSPWPSYLCSADLFSFHPVVLACYPPPSRPLGIYSYSTSEAKKAQRRDEGHNTNSQTGHVRCEDRQTKGRRRCRDRNGHAGRDAICHAIFELAGAGNLVSDGRGEGGKGPKGELGRMRRRTYSRSEGRDGYSEQRAGSMMTSSRKEFQPRPRIRRSQEIDPVKSARETRKGRRAWI
jgi:hypothetical protein